MYCDLISRVRLATTHAEIHPTTAVALRAGRPGAQITQLKGSLTEPVAGLHHLHTVTTVIRKVDTGRLDWRRGGQ